MSPWGSPMHNSAHLILELYCACCPGGKINRGTELKRHGSCFLRLCWLPSSAWRSFYLFDFLPVFFPWLVLKTLSVSSSPIHFLCILLLCFTASPSLSPMQPGNPVYIYLPHTQALARTHSCTRACAHTHLHTRLLVSVHPTLKPLTS